MLQISLHEAQVPVGRDRRCRALAYGYEKLQELGCNYPIG
jgi:hypothetical protein